MLFVSRTVLEAAPGSHGKGVPSLQCGLEVAMAEPQVPPVSFKFGSNAGVCVPQPRHVWPQQYQLCWEALVLF